MTEVLDGVVSTQTLGTCAREFLGFACLAGSGYDCTCADVRSAAVQVEDSKAGPVLVLSLELLPGILNTKPLIRAVHLTGYRAEWTQIGNGGLEHGVTLRVSYQLDRPENKVLKAHVEEQGF